jgi:hypothetical protein
MKANELRIGNLIKYTIEDDLDERKKWSEVSEIDAEDILHLTKFKDENYNPIPITEEWLLKFGGIKNTFGDLIFFDIYFSPRMCLRYYKIPNELDLIQDKKIISFKSNHIKYIHQLQNLYFALTGEELTLK